MSNILTIRITFGNSNLEKIYTVIIQNPFQNQNIKNTRVRTALRDLNIASLQYITLHYITLHPSTLQPQLHYITLHYIPLHSITLHYNHNYTTTQLHDV